MIYNDRKMLKWQGFFLSEHNEALAHIRQQQPIDIKEQQTSEVISQQLEHSWISYQPVMIQSNLTVDGDYQSPIYGQVIGFNGHLIYLMNGLKQYVVNSDDIRHVAQIETGEATNDNPRL